MFIFLQQTVNLTVLFFGSQVIAVILAVLLHHGNGRAIATSSDNIERMLGLAEEELNMIWNDTNENRPEENSADVVTSSEPDSSSHKAVQSQLSSNNMIQPNEEIPVLRQKRSHEGPCYTGNHQTVKLASGGVKTFPICKNVSLTGRGSSIKKYGERKCVGSDFETVSVLLANGNNQVRVFPRKCSCAV